MGNKKSKLPVAGIFFALALVASGCRSNVQTFMKQGMPESEAQQLDDKFDEIVDAHEGDQTYSGEVFTLGENMYAVGVYPSSYDLHGDRGSKDTGIDLLYRHLANKTGDLEITLGKSNKYYVDTETLLRLEKNGSQEGVKQYFVLLKLLSYHPPKKTRDMNSPKSVYKGDTRDPNAGKKPALRNSKSPLYRK